MDGSKIKIGKYESLNKKYMTKMTSLFSSRACEDIYNQLKAGKGTYLKYERTESSSFDMEWIKIIEDSILDLGEIIKNPKKNTRTEETLVPAELARKTNATSVRHLASHTKFVKDVDPYGNVTPSKILNIGTEDDYATYENRFIATLIRRLVLFIEKRYEYINEFVELKDVEFMMFKNRSIVDGKEVEIETKIKISSNNEATGTGKSSTYVQRIKEVRRYIRFYYNSPFMKLLKNERDVRNPILMTNIIRKNPLYNKAYKLYKFIENYDTLGVNFKINEKYNDFSQKEMDDLNTTIFANFMAMKGRDPTTNVIKENKKEYKPRVLTSIDEEQFNYGKLLRGPVQFVRVDDAYLDYLAANNSALPEKPKKEEKVYYEDELEEKEEKKVLLRAEKQLIARKEKEQRDWNKKAEKLVAQRIKEEQEALRKIEEAKRAEELSRIAKAREELKAEAKTHTSDIASEKKEERPSEDLFEAALRALQDQGVEDSNELQEEPIEEVQPEELEENIKAEDPVEEVEEISEEASVVNTPVEESEEVENNESQNEDELIEEEKADETEESNNEEELVPEMEPIEEESVSDLEQNSEEEEKQEE